MKIEFNFDGDTLADLENMLEWNEYEYELMMNDMINNKKRMFRDSIEQRIAELEEKQRIREQTEKSDGDPKRFMEV